MEDLLVPTAEQVPEKGESYQSNYEWADILSHIWAHVYWTAHLKAENEVENSLVDKVLDVKQWVLPLPMRAEVAQVHQAGELDKLGRDDSVISQKDDSYHKD